MKITILQQDLLPALQAVARSVGIRSTLPVLANILLQTEDGKLKLSATNLEVGVIKKVNAQINEQGEITVPARTLLEVVTPLTGNNLELEAAGEQLKITTQNFNATLNGISASEFPAIPISSEQAIMVPAKLLKTALPEITFAAAADEGRPILTGILTEISQGKLELVATDGFRLAHKAVGLETDAKTSFRALIPRRTFEEVVRLITEEIGESDEEKVEISTSENQNQMVFKVGQTQLSSRLIEGQFPAWEKIVPQKFENRTVLERDQLLKATKLASVFSRSEANIVKLETLKGKIRLSSGAKQLGEQETEVEAQSEGNPITIAF